MEGGGRFSKVVEEEPAHPFGPVLARRDAESLRNSTQAVTSFLRTVYNVLSTRVASFLAFRCIINEQLALAPWLTPLAPSFFLPISLLLLLLFFLCLARGSLLSFVDFLSRRITRCESETRGGGRGDTSLAEPWRTL